MSAQGEPGPMGVQSPMGTQGVQGSPYPYPPVSTKFDLAALGKFLTGRRRRWSQTL